MVQQTVRRFVERELIPLEQQVLRNEREGKPGMSRYASMGKLYGSNMGNRVVDRVLQIHGGMGYTKELPIERWYREARLWRIYDGTDEIQRLIISRNLLKGHVKVDDLLGNVTEGRCSPVRAWVVHQLGNPEEVLRLEERPAPVPQAGEVLIDVEAAGVNFLDLLLCAGTYQEKPPLPFTPGAEVTGRIRASGEGVDLPVGNRVIALPALPEGGYAEQIKVPADRVYPVPESMPPAEAAAFFISFHTAHYALHRLARLQRGEVLLVHAGAGGVGSAAIQLGKAAGAGVIATAGGREKVNICRELGADLAIDYREHDFVEAVKMATQGKGANVIFDPVGGDVFDQSRRCIAFEGRILVVGFAGGRIAQAPTNHALVKNYAIWGVHWGLFQRLFPQAVREAHRDLIALYQQGSIRPLVHHRFPFEQLPAALARLASRRTWGKVVLER